VRDAVAAKAALKNRTMFGVKLRLFTRSREELGASDDGDDDGTAVEVNGVGGYSSWDYNTDRRYEHVRLLDSPELGTATPTADTTKSSIPFPGSQLVEPPPPERVLFCGLDGRARPRSELSSSSGRVAWYPLPLPAPDPNPRASLCASLSAAHPAVDMDGRRSSNHLFFNAVGRFRLVRNHEESERNLDVDFPVSVPGPVADVQVYEAQDMGLGVGGTEAGAATPTFSQAYPPPLPPPPPHHQQHIPYNYGSPPDPTSSLGGPFYAPHYTTSSPDPGPGLHFPLPPPSPSFGYHPEPVGVGLHAWTWAPAPGGGGGNEARYYIRPGSPAVGAHTSGMYYPSHPHSHPHMHVQLPKLLLYNVNAGGEIPAPENAPGHGNLRDGVEYDYASVYLHHHHQQQQQDEGDRQQQQQYHEFFPTLSMFQPPSPSQIPHALTLTHITASPDISPSGFFPTPHPHPHPTATATAADRNQLNLTRIEDGQDTRTTVMVKNIPNKMSDRDLIAYIGNVCPRKIDFLYLRMDFQSGENSLTFFKDIFRKILLILCTQSVTWDMLLLISSLSRIF
jgi:hypothetical protein